MLTNVQAESVTPVHSVRPLSILVAAAWFGLLTGLVEGSAFLLFQKLGWVSWNISLWGVSAEIIWIAPALNLLLFSLLGVLIVTVWHVLPRLPAMYAAVWLFAFLMIYDWLSFSERVSHLGVYSLSFGVATALTRWAAKHESVAVGFWRRSLVWLVEVALIACVGIQGGSWVGERIATSRLPTASSGSPNILVIVVDALRADHLSSYEYARSTSPNLDRLAQQGVLFENAIATSSWTLPSHASILTGRYPSEHGATFRSYDGRYPTLAEVLRGRGYRTAAFSANTHLFSRNQGFGRGFIHFEDYFSSFADAAMRAFYGRKFYFVVMAHLGFEDVPGRKRASDVTSSAASWIEQDHAKPFFAFLNYFDVHEPYLPPQPYRSQFSKSKNPGGIVNGWMYRIGFFHPPLTPAQIQNEMDAYDGGIAYVDDSISRLLSELKARGLADNMLTVILSDHGEAFQEHGWMTHDYDLYREEIQVPLILGWAGHLPEGLRISRPVSLASLPATLMQLAGANDQTVFPGPSLAPLWQEMESPSAWPQPLAELIRVGKSFETNNAMRSLVSSRWHFITSPKQGPELYDWINDPRESNNLAGTPEGQQIVRRFLDQLQTVMAKR